MRILFSSAGGHGHLLPLMPLARAFRQAGHDVAVLTAESTRHLVESEDVELFVAVPSEMDVIEEIRRRTGVDLLAGVTFEGELDYFAGTRLDMAADDAIEVARTWKPDLVVCDIADFLAPLVAAAVGAPWAMLAYGTRRPDEKTSQLNERAATHYGPRGLVPAPPLAYLDTCPPTLNYPGWAPPVERLFVRPEAHRAESDVVVPPKGTRPRIVVTFGTVFGSASTLSPLLRALDPLDAEIVATLSGAQATDFDADVRERVTFVSFVPLDDLLRDVDVIVTHGGAGTTLAALARGVPLVIVPQGADQPRQAERVSAVGAGVTTDVAGVPDTVRRCLEDPAIRASAARLADEIAAMPTPADVVETLVQRVSD
ncbi:glycosyltransferase [Lentzea sp. NPDC051838]|uniref:glycosyltransferase n=1 Tax=Lentzea sp. NPDC051838 TaxID=3154849 RepID=UPI00343B1549